MPVTDLSGDDDWLQQFMAGHAAGQALGANPAFGASQPYGPSGYPDNLPNMRYGPPGGALLGLPGATQGAPSMGYPALSPGAPQPQPAQQPQPSALGYSLTSNPITRAIGALNPIGAAQADILHPNLSHPNLHPLSGGGNSALSPSQPLPPGAANSLPLAFGNPTLQDYNDWLSRQLATRSPAAPATAPPAGARPGGIGSDANFPVMGAGGQPTTYAAPGQQPPIPTASSGVSGANPANRGVATNRTPGVGAPQGNPSQTPQTANSTRPADRFVQVDRPNMPAAGGPRGGPPQMTALNLAGLFGARGGGQQAANPADVPAANAQPVSGALAPGGMSNAPWGMGPLQQWMNWPGSFGPFTPGQSAGRSLRQRYG